MILAFSAARDPLSRYRNAVVAAAGEPLERFDTVSLKTADSRRPTLPTRNTQATLGGLTAENASVTRQPITKRARHPRRSAHSTLDRLGSPASIPRVSQIHFVGGEKGGVGKSVVARLLAQYWIDRGRAFAGVDGDASHGALVRHYGDFSHFVDLSSSESADQILDRALGADRRVLVDLPAQSARSIDAWVDGANVLGLARELGTPITFWHVTDGGFASVMQLERALNRYGTHVAHVVVRNHGRSRDFSQLQASPAMSQLHALGGHALDLPELDANVMYKLDGAGASFWAAANAREGERSLKPLERERVKLWLARAYAELDKLGDSI